MTQLIPLLTAGLVLGTSLPDWDVEWLGGNRSPTVALARGRAHFLAGNLPEAVRAFRAGLEIAPYNHDLQQGLAHCRDTVAYPTPIEPAARLRPEPFGGLRARIAPADLLALALLGSLLATVGIARWFTRRDSWSLPLAIIGIALLAVIVAFAVCIEVETRRERSRPVQIVTADVPLRSGNGFSYPPRIETPLPRGAEVRERSRRGGWVQIEVPGGAAGWVPEQFLIGLD